jgi:hypothetical protein
VGAGFFEEEAIANLQRALEPLPPPLNPPKAKKPKGKKPPARRGREGWQKIRDLRITVEGVGERDAAIWHDYGTPVTRAMGEAGAWEARASGYAGRGDTEANALAALGEAWEGDPTEAVPVIDVFGLEEYSPGVWTPGEFIPEDAKGAPVTAVMGGQSMGTVRIAKNGIKLGDNIRMQGWGKAGSDKPARWYVEAKSNVQGSKVRHYKVTNKQAEKIRTALGFECPTVDLFRAVATDPTAAYEQVKAFEALRLKDRSAICAQLGVACDDLIESFRAAAFPPTGPDGSRPSAR